MIEILNQRHWHIEENQFLKLAPLILNRIESGVENPFRGLISKKESAFLSLESNILSIEQTEGLITATGINGERVAIIPLIGTMSKHGGLCSYGTVELAAMMSNAFRNKDISAVLMETDSGGGGSNSPEPLTRVIEARNKPVISWVDSMMASAALRTGAFTDKIIVDSLKNSYVGSIGTLMVHQNYAAKLRNDGVDVEIIRAPQSKEKALVNGFEPLSDEVRAQLKEEMRGLTDDFISDVKANRSNLSTEDPSMYAGKVYNGIESIENGFADEQGSMSDAFALAVDMANTKTKKSFVFNSNNHMSFFKTFGLSYALAQKLTAEEINSLDQAAERLASQKAELESANTQNETLTARVTELEASVAERDTQISEQSTQIETLQATVDETPAPAATTVVADEDKGPEYTDEHPNKKYHTSVDDEAARYKNVMSTNSK